MGEIWTREMVRGATVHKAGSKIPTWPTVFYINSDKHLPKSPLLQVNSIDDDILHCLLYESYLSYECQLSTHVSRGRCCFHCLETSATIPRGGPSMPTCIWRGRHRVSAVRRPGGPPMAAGPTINRRRPRCSTAITCPGPHWTRIGMHFNMTHSAVAFSTLQRKSHLCIPFLGIARPQPQFPHSCVCE